LVILNEILSKKIPEKSTRENDFERILWFVELMKWIQRRRNKQEKNLNDETVYSARLKLLTQRLNGNPELRQNFISNLTVLLVKISSAAQLSTAGLPEAASFAQEFVNRLQEKILPNSPLSEDLSTIMLEAFPTRGESSFFNLIDMNSVAVILELLDNNELLVRKLRSDIVSGCYILSHQLLNHSITIQKELRDSSYQTEALSEYQLEGYFRDCLDQKTDVVNDSATQLLNSVEGHTRQLYENMKIRGVNVELVYLFQIQYRKMNRLRMLMRFLDAETPVSENFRQFISELILGVQHQKSLRSFFSENLTLLTQRIVESNSQVGEHYVTFTWIEFGKMFRSALGGGGITAMTVMLKHVISQFGLSGMIKGLFDSLNYSGSFLGIQLMGWTLATKQPSNTALYLAQALKKSTTESRRSIVALLRTQFIAVIGNLSMVFPICLFIASVSLYFGSTFISEDEAMYMFKSTEIVGPTALFAAFTGVLLFIASLFAAWFENWVHITQLDQRIRYNRKLQKIFGVQRVKDFSQTLFDKANALAANIGLGVLLGMTPSVMKYVGIPLEARHVTLAMGGFAASLPMAIKHGIGAWDLLNSVLGIVVTGILNLSVSFLLACLLASISSKIKFASFWRFIKWGLRLVLLKPWLLIVPEKQKTTRLIGKI
jgi:site-specific recombinase